MTERLIYLKNVATLKLDDERCTGCGVCLSVCPHAVLVRDNGRVRVDNRDACMECGACMKNCPTDALEVRAGVGCAAAVINSALGKSGSQNCCALDTNDGVACCSEGSAVKRESSCC